MSLPAAWIEHLFAKLSVRYGSSFQRQWGDADPALVKADWAEVLDGVRGESLSYALRYLPNDPPNALRFRDLCRMAPAPAQAAITDKTPADPQRVKAAMSALQASKFRPNPNAAQECIDNIERACNGKPSSAQRAMIRSCLGVAGTKSAIVVAECVTQ